MKNFKNSIFYISILVFFSGVIYNILSIGKVLETHKVASETIVNHHYLDEFIVAIKHNIFHPLAILLAQIVTIIFVARFFGWICRRIGQPTVIGEMIAGIALGPSLFGLYFPEWSLMLFPKESLVNLKFLSQIGLILFMFVIGMELDLKILRTKVKEAFIISHTSIIVSYALGLLLAYTLYKEFAPKNVPFMAFGLFMGVAMSIAAFPVLARIVQERGLSKTKLGALVITCAAIDDITAWCLLAGVIAIVKAGSVTSSLFVIGMAVVYIAIMLGLVRPFLKKIGELYGTSEKITKPVVAIFFLVLIMSSYLTEIIGIHALVGAFVAGVIMPENMKFRNIFIEKVEDVSLVMLLPLFFVVTGLNTKIGLLNTEYLWKTTGLIVLVAVGAKFVSTTLTSKFVGQNWRDSLTMGALMNTRGLMELIVLNIGLELGVLSPKIFAMMVIMALSTTFMTGPLLNLIDFVFKRRKNIVPTEITNTNYNVLVSFDNTDDGKKLIKVANNFISNSEEDFALTAMYVSSTNEINPYKIEEYEKESFKPILKEAEKNNIKLATLFKTSKEIDSDIIETSNQSHFNFSIITIGTSIYEGTILGKLLGITSKIINPENLLNTIAGKEKLFETKYFDDKTESIINKTETSLGIFVDKNLLQTHNISLILFNQTDLELLKYVEILKKNSEANIEIFDTNNLLENHKNLASEKVIISNQNKLDKEFLTHQDLLIISIESWKKLIDTRSVWLNNTPSLLIIKP